MKDFVNEELFEPIITVHPDNKNIGIFKPYGYKSCHEFVETQEDYEKYEMPGLMPKDPKVSEQKKKARVKKYDNK